MPAPVVTLDQMRQWEEATWKKGQTQDNVIRRAGEAVAFTALRMSEPNDRILIIAGKGNNGADALHAEPHLSNRLVDTMRISEPEKAAAELKKRLKYRPALIIDGIFGIGLNRPLSEPYKRLISVLNGSGVPVLAVDVPSGFNISKPGAEGVAVKAAATVTMGGPKTGMLTPDAPEFMGRIISSGDIGLSTAPKTEMLWTLPGDFKGFPPPRPVDGHKGTFGHVVIIAGSLGYHGAAVLCAAGALRARPGLVTICTQQDVYIPVASQCRAAMVHPWTSDFEMPAAATVIVTGPGLAADNLSTELKSEIDRLWRKSSLPMVVDASALQWLTPGRTAPNSIRVITPHPGEAARCLDITPGRVLSDRLASLRALSKRYGNCIVALKGQYTLIGKSSGNVFVNSSGNPFLAQGGSGDVLSGYLAGLLGQSALQSDPVRTVRYGVWQHAAAADRLTETFDNWTLDELIPALGAVRP